MIGKDFDRRGFTLLEITLAVSVSAMLVGALGTLLAAIYSAQAKAQAVEEVEMAGATAIQAISYAIRNADAIISPPPGEMSADLEVQQGSSTIRFRLQRGRIYVRRDEVENALTTNRVVVAPFYANNLGGAEAGTVHFEFDMGHQNLSGRPESEYIRTFRASASQFSK